MDGTRLRRTQDLARQKWYAVSRSVRFARHMSLCLTVQQEKEPVQTYSGRILGCPQL